MNDSSKFDVLVIGGGPGGIEAAIQAGRRKLKTGLISATPIGGRAIFFSLVPSKVWVQFAEEALKNNRNNIEKTNLSLTIEALKNKIDGVSKQTSKHYQNLLESYSVKIIKGNARYETDTKVTVESDEGTNQQLSADFLILATGSVATFFEGVKPNGERIIAPKFAKQLTEIPRRLIMVGGGVTGCEFASAFSALGAEVMLVTDMPALLPQMDLDLQQSLEKSFLDRGIAIRKSAPVRQVVQEGENVLVCMSNQESLEADYAFLALGKKADLSFLGEHQNDFRIKEDNGIWTDPFQQTSVKGIYAIGDVTGGKLLANKALYQAKISVAHLVGEKVSGYDPGCQINAVYTHPEIASIGLTEQESRDQKKSFKIVRKDIANLIKYRLDKHAEGFLKLILDAEDEKILGAHLIGDNASELLAPILVGKRAGMKYSEMGQLPFAYPAFSELLLRGSHHLE